MPDRRLKLWIKIDVPGPHCVHIAKELVVERPMEGVCRSNGFLCGQENASVETPAASTSFAFALEEKVMGVFGGDCRLLPLDRPCSVHPHFREPRACRISDI